jgi:hypothetical protein
VIRVAGCELRRCLPGSQPARVRNIAAGGRGVGKSSRRRREWHFRTVVTLCPAEKLDVQVLAPPPTIARKCTFRVIGGPSMTSFSKSGSMRTCAKCGALSPPVQWSFELLKPDVGWRVSKRESESASSGKELRWCCQSCALADDEQQAKTGVR